MKMRDRTRHFVVAIKDAVLERSFVSITSLLDFSCAIQILRDIAKWPTGKMAVGRGVRCITFAPLSQVRGPRPGDAGQWGWFGIKGKRSWSLESQARRVGHLGEGRSFIRGVEGKPKTGRTLRASLVQGDIAAVVVVVGGQVCSFFCLSLDGKKCISKERETWVLRMAGTLGALTLTEGAVLLTFAFLSFPATCPSGSVQFLLRTCWAGTVLRRMTEDAVDEGERQHAPS
ncbi:hypothetical protein LZ30DRAFT_808860 [Colletotrichum cereale]|nr:hypothetical protein LZ30DRAFT_808860 [Colletotrichum cereale]